MEGDDSSSAPPIDVDSLDDEMYPVVLNQTEGHITPKLMRVRNAGNIQEDHKVIELDWVDILKKFLLPHSREEEDAFYVGIAFDIFALVIWFILIFTILTEEERIQGWFMPFVGIVGSMVSIATPAGGGIFYFPFLTFYGISASSAIAFNISTSAITLSLFGTVSWISKSRNSILTPVVVVILLTGWVGTLAMIYLPLAEEFYLRLSFMIFCFFLLCYVCYLLWMGEPEIDGRKQIQNFPDFKSVSILIITGIIGGTMVSYLGVGMDMLIFVVLGVCFKVDSRVATGTSIVATGWGIIVIFLVRLIYFQDVPVALWLMSLGGLPLGARLGLLVNKLFGKENVLLLFGTLLLAEVIRTPIQYVIKVIYS